MKIFIALAFIYIVCANDEDFTIIDSIEQEMPCRQEGGVCTIAGDCPAGKLSEKQGLCPNQQGQGIECCYGVSVKETRCSKHGGGCMGPEMCGPIVFDGATDCPEDQKCCIFV